MAWKLAAAIGLALQLGGISMALWGLHEVAGELFPSRPLPPRLIWRWVRRHLGRRNATQVFVDSGTASITAVGGGRAQGTKGRPAADAPLSAWSEYWKSRMHNIDERIDWLVEDMQQADADIRGRLDSETRARAEADQRLDERLHVVVGGPNGSGLAKAWWGLLVTGIGTLLGGLPGIFG